LDVCQQPRKFLADAAEHARPGEINDIRTHAELSGDFGGLDPVNNEPVEGNPIAIGKLAADESNHLPVDQGVVLADQRRIRLIGRTLGRYLVEIESRSAAAGPNGGGVSAAKVIHKAAVCNPIEPATESVSRSIVPKSREPRRQMSEHLLPHVLRIAGLKPPPPTPTIHQRSIQADELFPRINLPPGRPRKQAGGSAGLLTTINGAVCQDFCLIV
jgi:hypothetical protein